MTLNRKILIGFIGCVVILFIVSMYSYRNSEKYIATNDWVTHTYEVLYELEQVYVFSIDASAGMRGFVITGDKEFLEPYANAKLKMMQHFNKIKQLTEDNSVEQKNLENLQRSLDKHIIFLEDCIELRKKDFQKAVDKISTGEGKQILDEIATILNSSREIEEKLLADRKIQSKEDAANFNKVFSFLLLIIVLVLVAVYIIIHINIKALNRAEEETANKNWILSGTGGINSKTQGEKTERELAQNIVNQLAQYLHAQIGAVYLFDNSQLVLAAGYAFDYSNQDIKSIKLGEGLVGQAASEKKHIVFNNVPGDYIKVN